MRTLATMFSIATSVAMSKTMVARMSMSRTSMSFLPICPCPALIVPKFSRHSVNARWSLGERRVGRRLRWLVVRGGQLVR